MFSTFTSISVTVGWKDSLNPALRPELVNTPLCTYWTGIQKRCYTVYAHVSVLSIHCINLMFRFIVLSFLHICILQHSFSRWHDVPFSPTKGKDHVKTSMKLGNQYGCGEQLNCRMFITLFSYFNTAAKIDRWKETGQDNTQGLTSDKHKI